MISSEGFTSEFKVMTLVSSSCNIKSGRVTKEWLYKGLLSLHQNDHIDINNELSEELKDPRRIVLLARNERVHEDVREELQKGLLSLDLNQKVA